MRENIFLKDQLFFFRAQSRFILGRIQWRNQGDGAKGASVPFRPSHLENITKNEYAFKRVLDLT